MSKYNITINEINLDNDAHTASGIIMKNGEEVQFEAATIWWSGTRRWKIKEEGQLAVKVSSSSFTQGERMAVARWLGEVSKNQELIGKPSGQGTGRTSPQPNKRVQELEEQNSQLQSQMEELRAMMIQLTQLQSESNEEVVEEPVDEETPKPKRKSRSKKS